MKKALIWICILALAVPVLAGSLWSYIRWKQVDTLIQAIEMEDTQKVKKLLGKSLDPNRTDLPPRKIWSLWEISPRHPLAEACRTGNLEIVQLLITYGATAETAGGAFSPLTETIFYYQPNDLEIVKILLENGVDLKDTQDADAVFLAAQMVPKVYDDQMENGTVFVGGYDEATAKGITEIVRILLADRSINCTTQSGKTLLMFAVQKENVYLADYLIAAGADITVSDINGKTAYDYAVDSKNNDLISLFENKVR